MSPADEVRVYFRQVVLDYSCGDVNSLLSLCDEGKLDKAGPLLACVVNGIDMLGGMMLGFARNNSQMRSIAFMQRHLGLPEDVAKALYVLVRCGVSHEGTTKLTLRYFVRERSAVPSPILSYGEGSLWLDVTQLACEYLCAVERIAQDVTAYLKYVPMPNPQDEALLAALDLAQFPDLADLLSAAGPAIEAAERREAERRGVPHSSSRPFLREDLALLSQFSVGPGGA
jgi:hypothetical protein